MFKNALVIGNGPSAWWLTPQQISRLRDATPGLVVIGTNLVGFDLRCDIVAAVDHAMADAIADRMSAEYAPVIATTKKVADRVGLLTNVHELEPQDAGYSSGVAAAHVALKLGALSITLIGFDGSVDNRTKHYGEKNYRSNPTRPSLYRRWESRLAELAQAYLDCEWRLHQDGGAHPLDALPAPRVDLTREVGVLS